MRGGEGFVGWGVHERFSATGPDAARADPAVVRRGLRRLRVDDAVGMPGSGPIAFVSLGFDDDDVSVAIVPKTVMGSAAATAFRTDRSGETRADGRGSEPASAFRVTRAGSATPTPTCRWPGSPPRCAAAARIRAGELQKVVLAHDLEATTTRPVDERFLLQPARRGLPGLLDLRRRGSASAPARNC